LDNQEHERQEWRDSNEIVSFDDEPLVLVDHDDHEVGFMDKASAHEGKGTLHRAFSLFVFNAKGELLCSSAHRASACGRAFGPIPVAAIRAVAKPWTTPSIAA
jgi:hypothetical protein